MPTKRKPLPPGATVLPHPEHPDLPYYARPVKADSPNPPVPAAASSPDSPTSTPPTPPKALFAPGGPGGPGRTPRTYPPEIYAEIIQRLADGEFLYQICDRRARPDMPSTGTVVGWAHDDDPPGFAAAYDRARRLQAEAGAEKTVRDVRDAALAAEGANPKGAEVVWKAETWYWRMMHPRRFADRQTVAIEDPRGELAKLLGVPRESIPE